MTSETSDNKLKLTSRFFQNTYRILFWSYKRGTLPYDIMCLIILMFIFLIPVNFFHDKPELDNKLLESREGIHWIHESEENFLPSIHSEFLSVNQDNNSFKKSIQDHVEKVLKKSIIISNVEPVTDANGKTITYLVWMKQR